MPLPQRTASHWRELLSEAARASDWLPTQSGERVPWTDQVASAVYSLQQPGEARYGTFLALGSLRHN